MNSSATGAAGVPGLSFRIWRGGKKRHGTVHYDENDHRDVPHVVKFSGGRSSGLMLLILLENGLLKAERGDVVLFTNTSAEHPATYDFVRKIKRVSERVGIPFFIAQLHTVETVAAGEWRRRLTYRLANDQPKSPKNPWGYNYRGEVFEEAIAWTGMLPSVHTRVCTTLMKMFVTREFLSDWFAGVRGIPAQGHQGGATQVDPDVLYREHLKQKGKMSFPEFEVRHKVLRQRPTFRPHQQYREFTKAPLAKRMNEKLCESVFGNKCALFGDRPASFLTHLGFRAGETARYQRMLKRNRGGATPGQDTHPPGEFSYAPLFELGIDQEKVLRFWADQPASLRPYLPEDMNLSNCVYCFLKGPRSLAEIRASKGAYEKALPGPLQKECRRRGTPNSIDWWVRIENSHERKADQKSSENGSRRTFGMFGLKAMNYQEIKKQADRMGRIRQIPPKTALPQSAINCECTD